MSVMLSIIVPVYNASEQLARCIESICKQDFKDFELLLMDDGSKDDSGEICDKYAAKDARIKVIHKDNSGVSDTRNMAIGMASGEYLQFVDSDDWITPEASGQMVRAVVESGADMVITDFYRVVGERLSVKGNISEDGVLTREEFASHMMSNPADFYYGVLWNKLFKRSIIEKYGLRMNPEISWCEDFMFNLEYLRHVEKVYALHVPTYYYVKTKGSLVATQGMSMTKTIQMKRMVFAYYHKFYKDIFTEEDYEKNRLQVYLFLIDSAGDGFVPPVLLSKKLGAERMTISSLALKGKGLLMEAFRENKLLDRHLETVAMKNDLSLKEVRMLLVLSRAKQLYTPKELAEITRMPRGSVSLLLQRLESKGFIKVVDTKKTSTDGKKREREKAIKEVVLLQDAEPVVDDMMKELELWEQEKYQGLSEDEVAMYEALTERIQDNIQDALRVNVEKKSVKK